MRDLYRSRALILVAAALMAIAAAPAGAEEARAPEVARMDAAPGSITWEPSAAFDKLTLTISGGGHVITREFTGRPHFTPVDPDGYLLPDGAYTWELTAASRAAARAAASSGDEVDANGRAAGARAEAPALSQSGAFTILDGAIVAPAPRAATAITRRGAEAGAAEVDDSDGGGR